MSRRPTMSRAVRTARGAFGAIAATLLAAASHALAGGPITPLAVIATVILAMPLCVALAGSTGSLWRIAIAVFASQALFHWSFSGLGIASARGSAPQSGGLALLPHAAHFDAVASFVPQLAAAASADSSMWLAHAAAAVVTTVLLHRGERAAMRLIRVLRDTVAVRLPATVRVPHRPAILARFAEPARRTTQVFLCATRLRGPPESPSFA